MAQEDEVAGRMYAELDLLEGTTDAPRGSVLHQELVSDYVRRAMRDKDSIMHVSLGARHAATGALSFMCFLGQGVSTSCVSL